jgi:hypothetical protein
MFSAGEPDRALEQIDLLLSIPNAFTPGFFNIEPSYAELRQHPRYEEVLGKYRT